MLSDGGTQRVTHSLGVLAALAVTLGVGFCGEETHAGPLAQLQIQSRTVKSPPRMDLCVGGARTPKCRAALDSALHSAAHLLASRGTAQSGHAFYSSDAMVFASREPLPVTFNTDPEWKKRAIRMAHEGLTFLRMPQGGGREFIVGINRHGFLGFSLQDSNGN